MEDLNKLLKLTETYPMQLEQMTEEFILKLRVILWGHAAITVKKEKVSDIAAPSPQQTMKRVKRLSSLTEDNEMEDKLENARADGKSDNRLSPKKSRRSNAALLADVESMVDAADIAETPVAAPRTQFENPAVNNKENVPIALQDTVIITDTTNLMPPPAPVASADDTLNKRPQRAAKLKSEKNLKEPRLNAKLRRPTNEIKIKLEHEQRPSQIHETISESSKHSVLTELNENANVKSSISSGISDDSVSIIPGKEPSLVSINSDVTDATCSIEFSSTKQCTTKGVKKSACSTDYGAREVCVKIKREKLSFENEEKLTQKLSDDSVFKLPAPIQSAVVPTKDKTSSISSILSATSDTTTTQAPKKGRKKKEIVHKPIKVERFSDLDAKPNPISSRTRHGSTNKCDNVETPLEKEITRPSSVYEDAVEAPPIANTNEVNLGTGADGVVNETVVLGQTSDVTLNLGPIPNDATFCTNPVQTTFQVEANPNATITLNKHSGSGPSADATFDIHHVPRTSKDKADDIVGQRSFETAKDTSLDSLLTEDEQEKPTEIISKATNTNKTKETAKGTNSAKAPYKMPTRTNELFNPLVQSPVKMRVEAFENAAAAASEQSKRPLRTRKENVSSSTSTTPVIGKLPAPALGRFLTPTQSSNLSSVNSAIAKKTTTSASKAMPMPKSACASSLQRSNSTASTKAIQRENSADDFRKGLHNLAEERKKQREQKHLLAAQQREAKERERAERMAKLAKEREEKRKLKKQQEQEQKKRELEEIQRKLRQQKEEEEAAAKLKAAKEREMQLQMKQQQQLAKQKMMPPPPKTATKYTFEMLHEDDSTDDEDKVSYKRPPPPTWSRSHVRGPFVLKQEYTPSVYIDSFFSVQPMTPDLKIIFPNIDARHLKRNSSVFWSTPPRYSELPKY